MATEEAAAAPPPLAVEDEEVVKARMKNEAYLTSNLGYGNAKKRELEVFNKVVWPRLTEAGWVQVEGTLDKVGSVYFLPSKDTEVKYGRRGKDYYVRIRDVIDRVLQRRNDVEAKIADAYQEEIDVLENEAGYERAPPEPTTRRLRPPRHATRIDLSWKEGGSAFPRTRSRVGCDYQAVDLPSSDTFEKGQEQVECTDFEADEERTIIYDQVWDPKRAEAAGILDYVSQNVKYNLKEAAMVLLHELGYDKDKLSEALSSLEPEDGSNWTDEEKAKFRIEIFRQRKDLSAVAKSMNKSIDSCMTYYLSSFKKSDDYRLLKTLCAEERADKMIASESGFDACEICDDGGNLLICDGCEGEFHMQCMMPPLAEVPEGHWECDECVNRKFLKARDNLIRNTRIYETVPVEESSNRKRKSDGIESDWSADGKKSSSDDGAGIALRPNPHVLEAVKRLAFSISQALDAPKGVEPAAEK